MPADCIFCKIAAGETSSELLYQDDLVTAFRDIQPVAPSHILIVPNTHVESLNDLTESDELLAGRLLRVAQQLAREEGIHDSGYRVIINTGPDGRQVVFHLHVHLIGGQRMRHPMG